MTFEEYCYDKRVNICTDNCREYDMREHLFKKEIVLQKRACEDCKHENDEFYCVDCHPSNWDEK